MKKSNLIIADRDERYINNLMNYISKNYSSIFNVSCFTEHAYIEEYIKKGEKVDIVLMDLEFFKDNIDKYKDVFVVLLTENLLEYEGYGCIKKYQSAEKICNDIIRSYEANGKNVEESEEVGDTKVLTFYSPIGGIGTSTLAISTAYLAAKKRKKILYINLENIQSTEIFINDSINPKYNLSDLIFSIKNRSNSFLQVFNSSIKKCQHIDLYYFGVVDSLLDIEELTSDNIKDLIENIQKIKLFNFIVVDLPSTLHTKYYNLFQKSSNVFVAIGQDKRSNYKIDTLLEQLDDTENFLFIVNKLNESKEQLFPRTVSINTKPVIQNINFYDEIEGTYDFDKYFQIPSEFKEKMEEIVNLHVLN